MKGFLLIDKEKGETSFDVVAKLRRLTGVGKIGHSGTLDPLATGLLLVAVGEGTKLLEYFVGLDKEYEVVARFGAVSSTYDAAGGITESDFREMVSVKDLEKMIKEDFLGEIYQVPPIYSAIKIAGKKAYEYARKGQQVELKPRKVRIDKFEILEFKWPVAKFLVKCGSGTYIRSLIHDLGAKLGCGSYVEELRRTLVGDLSVKEALLLGEVENLNKKIEQGLISLEKLVGGFPRIHLTDEEYRILRNGGLLKDKKIEQSDVSMAFYKKKLVGVVEKFPTSYDLKFRKQVL